MHAHKACKHLHASVKAQLLLFDILMCDSCVGIPAAEQRVMFGGRQLEDQASLASEGVSDESTMYILMRLLGGAKKRKKKTYTKPKKQKHKHKKIKLAVLKFYKVCHT